MSMYRKEWDCCGSVTETDAWEPEICPFCTPAAANKSAEEGELPDEGILYGYFRKNGKQFDMLKRRPNDHTLKSGWIPLYTTKKAADRAARPCDLTDYSTPVISTNTAQIGAARPVANKAEVEPYGWRYECVQPGTDGKGWSEFFSRIEPKTERGVRNITALYATPPATTGASTVLTDERIDEIARPWCGLGGVEDQYAFARAITREVAAQAGQVAVPEDVARDAERYRALRDGGNHNYRLGQYAVSGLRLWGQLDGDRLDRLMDKAIEEHKNHWMTAALKPASESLRSPQEAAGTEKGARDVE